MGLGHEHLGGVKLWAWGLQQVGLKRAAEAFRVAVLSAAAYSYSAACPFPSCPASSAHPPATCSGDNADEAAAWEAAWHSEAWLRALALFLRRVYGSPAELADAMLDVVGSLYRTSGFATEGMEVAEQAWVHALGVAGLLLEQLTSARPALAAGGTFGLRDLLDSLIQPGLRHRSAKVIGAGVEVPAGLWEQVALGCAHATVWRPGCMSVSILCWGLASLTLAPSPIDPPITHLQVRREAVRCLGLYTFLDGIPTLPGSHLMVLRQVLITPGESSTVRAVAAQVSPCLVLVSGGPVLSGSYLVCCW